MFKHIDNQKGLTLAELLASIALLSIVLVTFMAFFTNAFQFNAISSDKMNTTNLAREVQEKFKVNDTINQELKNLLNESEKYNGPRNFPKESFPDLNLNQDILLTSSGILELSLADQNYRVFVFVDKHPVEKTSLYKLHVQVLDHEKILSETFTYIDYK